MPRATDDPGAAVVCFATQGSGSGDERRIVELLAEHAPDVLPFDRSARPAMVLRLVRELRRRRPAIVVMEGTGVAGGLAVLIAERWCGVPYVVSTGDAVAAFIAASRPWLRLAGSLYERTLYARSAAVIAWSPYLAGRAIALGAPRAATAANWCEARPGPDARVLTRRRLGIPDEAIVFGLVGSLNLSRRLDWCYGVELVRAIRTTHRDDVRVLIIGSGTGRSRLEALAADDLGTRIMLPGSCPPEQVLDYLAAMDIGSLPQTVDELGALRYTTKLSEYVAAGLPVVTGELPLAYDLDTGWIWRLPGKAPWETRYIEALGSLMATVSRDQVAARRTHVPAALDVFDRAAQQRRVSALVSDLLAERGRAQTP